MKRLVVRKEMLKAPTSLELHHPRLMSPQDPHVSKIQLSTITPSNSRPSQEPTLSPKSTLKKAMSPESSLIKRSST